MIPMTRGAVLALTASLLGAQTSPPPDLVALMAKTGVEGRAVGWCRGSFVPGARPAYAAAVASGDGTGRYIVIDEEAQVMALEPFKGVPDVSCYSPAEARKLHESIRLSSTITGEITPAFPTTVVCGFVDGTTAVCWQYSPSARAFVRIGGWQT